MVRIGGRSACPYDRPDTVDQDGGTTRFTAIEARQNSMNGGIWIFTLLRDAERRTPASGRFCLSFDARHL